MVCLCSSIIVAIWHFVDVEQRSKVGLIITIQSKLQWNPLQIYLSYILCSKHDLYERGEWAIPVG